MKTADSLTKQAEVEQMKKSKTSKWPEEVLIVVEPGEPEGGLLGMAYSSISEVSDRFHGYLVAVYRYVGLTRLNVEKTLVSDIALPDKRKKKK